MTCEQLRNGIVSHLKGIHSKRLLEMLYQITRQCFLREDKEEDE